MIALGRRGTPMALGVVAAIGGAIVALHYHRLGLTLSHYDARGHLVVSRRVIDSITPGWQQIGAVWLPLPHLLNTIPVQIDVLYRTGASGVALSVGAFAVAAGGIAWLVIAMTESSAAAIAAAAVFALNPNVLYLQSTPMTEPLLLALTTVAVAMLVSWSRADSGGGRAPDGNVGATAVAAIFALACLTRYEAWPVTAFALAAAVWTRWRRGGGPAVAIAGFLIFSRVVIGEWFVSSGFFVPENKSLGLPALAAAEIWWGTHMLSGSYVLAAAALGAVLLLLMG